MSVCKNNTVIQYKIQGENKCGQLKGTMTLSNAHAKIVDSTYAHHFVIELYDEQGDVETTRDLTASNAQELSDWVTALNTASCAQITEPIAHL